MGIIEAVNKPFIGSDFDFSKHHNILRVAILFLWVISGGAIGGLVGVFAFYAIGYIEKKTTSKSTRIALYAVSIISSILLYFILVVIFAILLYTIFGINITGD